MEEALRHVRTGGVTEAARDDTQGRFRRGDSVGFIDEELVAWGEPGETLEVVLGELGREAELLTVIEGDGAPLAPASAVARSRAATAPRSSSTRGGQPSWWWLVLRRVRATTIVIWRGPPTAFATNDPLPTTTAPRAAAFPRPSRLDTPLKLARREGGEGRPSGSGCTPSASCWSTSRATAGPRARSASWRSSEVATVVVEVRSITSRPVRRRGMKPLVEARVADETGTMTVTFFNQPWLERRYRPGHAAAADRQVPGPARLPRQRARRDRRAGRRRARTWRPTRPPTG